jgi:competence protein ComGC
VRGLKHETGFTMGAIVIVLVVIVAWKVPAIPVL